MNKNTSQFIGGCLLSLGGTVLVLSTLAGGSYNITLKDWINIGVTVLGFLIIFLGVIFGAIILLKRDSKTIDSISGQTNNMDPKVGHIEKMAEAQAKDIGLLISDLDHRKRMEAQYPQGSGKDMIYSGVDKMLEQYKRISDQYWNAKQQISTLQQENAALSEQNKKLLTKNQQLERKIQQLQRQRSGPERDRGRTDWELEL